MLLFRSLFVPVGLVLLCTQQALAAGNPHVATMTRVFGDVQLLTNPSKKVEGKEKHALYEGMYYHTRKAKAGDQMQNGNVVQTGKAARVRVVYENGDQFSIGANSAFQVNWDDKGTAAKPGVSVLMGAFRGIVRPNGPRSGMEVKTRSAVMGVRGTDFFVTSRNASGDSTVTVLRGKVAVKPQSVDVKPVEIPAGYSASVPTKPAPIKPEAKGPKGKTAAPNPNIVPIVLNKTSREELSVIHEETKVKKPAPAEVGESGKQLDELEKKAAENTLEDIKTADPTMFKRLEKTTDLKTADVDTLQDKTIEKLSARAPEKKKAKYIKPTLKDLQENSYDTYFKFDPQ